MNKQIMLKLISYFYPILDRLKKISFAQVHILTSFIYE